MATTNPTVKILDTAKEREINTKAGKRTVHYQPVQIECEQFRVNVEMDIDGVNDAKKVGERFEWDVVADLVPGQYASIDLSRRMTLRPLSGK
jgi:hypothetical protein